MDAPDRPIPGALDPQELRRQLEKIVRSRTFRSARAQRKFIQFAVEETLAGRAVRLKEFSIAVEAFGRADSFDPRLDPIVRTEARKLRVRLARYYETEGQTDSVRIELPKGAYVPVFSINPPVPSQPENALIEPVLPPATLPSTRRMGLGLALAVFITAASVVTGVYVAHATFQATGKRPVKPSAYQNYRTGLHFWNKLTAEGLKASIKYFEQAIAEDPSFARAYSALADAYVMAPQVNGAPAPEVVSKIRSLASKALALDSSLGEAHFNLAICAQYDFDWVTAEREFKKGLELSPGSVMGHLWYAKHLALTGRLPDVLVHRKIGLDLNPVSPYAIQAVGGYLSVMGRYDEAIEHFQRALALEPNFGLARQGLGVAYVLKGLPDKGIAELQAACSLFGGPRREALLGYAYGVSGRTAAARRILAGLHQQMRRGPLPALTIAQVYIGLGDKDRAFEWLEKAIEERDLGLTLQWDSIYAPLRSDPRYFRLLRRMKLV